MAFHDEYLRKTPFELAFPDPQAMGARMADIGQEAEDRGADTGDLGAFAMLASVNGFLKELGGDDASTESILQFAALAFHGYHLHTAPGRTYLVNTHVCRYLVDAPVAEGAPRLPAPAGYAQLPRHLFWIQGDAAQPAEAVDGFFWSSSESRLHVLLAVGMRDDRPGLAVVPLPEAPLADAESWQAAQVRDDGDDFANALPGGELEGLYSLSAAGEVFKLVARIFAYVERFPDAVKPGPEVADGAAPAPSTLPYRRITLDG